MSKTLTVDLVELRAALAYRRLINGTPLSEIEWVDGGKPASVTQAQIDDWLFTGLNNVDFGADLITDIDCKASQLISP